MSAAASSRRAVAELRPGGARPSWSMIGARSLHQFWPMLAPHFRQVLLAPQRRADSGAVSWSWQAAAGPDAPSAEELAELRRRLERAGRAYTAAATRAIGNGEPETGDEALVRAGVDAMVRSLMETSDAELGGFVARTDSGLMLHSWGAMDPAHPYFPDTHECEISGTVIGGEDGAAGLNLVIENRQGVVLSRIKSGAAGEFRFEKIGAGDYRIRVTGRGDFPATGYAVTVERESISGLELHRGAAVATFAPGAGRGAARDAPLGELSPDDPAVRRRFRMRRNHFQLIAFAAIVLVGVWLWSPWRTEAAGTKGSAPPWWQAARGKLAAIIGAPPTSVSQFPTEPKDSDIVRLSGSKKSQPEAPPEPKDGDRLTAGQGGDAAPIGAISPHTLVADDPVDLIAPLRTPLGSRLVAGTETGKAGGHVSDSPQRPPGPTSPTEMAAGQRRAHGAGGSPAEAGREHAPAGTRDAVATESDGGATSAGLMRDPKEALGVADRSVERRAAGALPSGRMGGRAPSAAADSGRSMTAGAETTTSRSGPAAPAAGSLARNSNVAAARPATAAQAASAGRATRSSDATAPGEMAVDASGPISAAGAPEVVAVRGTGAAAPEESGHRWRRGVSEFRIRLVVDGVVPTVPLPDGAGEPVEVMRGRELRERQARLPAALAGGVVMHGFAVELFEADVTGGRVPGWHDREGSAAATTMVRGTVAEVSWRAGMPIRAGRLVLRHPDGRDLARAQVEPDGLVSLETVSVVRAWHWIGIDCGPEEATAAPRYEWRFQTGVPVPATWSRDDRWPGGRGHRLDLPLETGVTGRTSLALALVDPASGWGLAGEVFRP